MHRLVILHYGYFLPHKKMHITNLEDIEVTIGILCIFALSYFDVMLPSAAASTEDITNENCLWFPRGRVVIILHAPGKGDCPIFQRC